MKTKQLDELERRIEEIHSMVSRILNMLCDAVTRRKAMKEKIEKNEKELNRLCVVEHTLTFDALEDVKVLTKQQQIDLVKAVIEELKPDKQYQGIYNDGELYEEKALKLIEGL